MKRVASLYLPSLSIDRLRRAELGPQPDRPPRYEAVGLGSWLPPSRLPENAKERAKLTALRERLEEEGREGERIEDCSCPRAGGWRPGARWARGERQAQIDALPAHQRPPMRMLGRRTEAAQAPFRGHSQDAVMGSGQAHKGDVTGNSPLVTTERSGQRTVLAAVSPEAAALGLQPGMAVTQARMLVPGLDLRPAEPEADAALLTRIAMFAARRWTPRAALSGPDGLWLDLDGVAHLFGGEQRMCEHIVGFCNRLGLSARIAVAGTTGSAHALARFGTRNIHLCPNGSELAAIAGFPPVALRLSETALAATRRFGIETAGELVAMARGPLARRLGHVALLRIDQALGRAEEPIHPIVPEDPPQALLRLVEPILSAEAIEQVLSDLVLLLTGMLGRRGLAARRIELVCERVDGEEQRLLIGTARPSRDPRHLTDLLKMKVEQIDPGFGIEAMRLVGHRCEPLPAQQLGSTEKATGLPQLIDRIVSRIGSRQVFHCSAVESDVPERSVIRTAPLDPVEQWPREWPRPVRLLSPPEPIDKVIAELPDQPPVRFVWRGKMHRVRKADGPERIHGEWWKRSGEDHAVRDYFQVEDEGGARFWLFRRGDGVDGRTGDLNWYVHGLFA